MPKGPQGQQRPADAIGCAVRVVQTATAEVDEVLVRKSGRKRSGTVGVKARNSKLGSEDRSNIVKVAAEARWSEKESIMSEKERLIHTLFERPGKELMNIKFFRGSGEDISEDRFCAEVNKILFEIDNELTDASEGFNEEPRKKTDVKELVKKLS